MTTQASFESIKVSVNGSEGPILIDATLTCLFYSSKSLKTIFFFDLDLLIKFILFLYHAGCCFFFLKSQALSELCLLKGETCLAFRCIHGHSLIVLPFFFIKLKAVLLPFLDTLFTFLIIESECFLSLSFSLS